jgi:colicin import membrane protein
MKTLKYLFLLLVFMLFGNSNCYSQNTKPQRTYTKKEETSTKNTTIGKPIRTYATKPENKNMHTETTISGTKNPEPKAAIPEKNEKEKSTSEKEKSGGLLSWLFGNSTKTNTKAQKTSDTYKGHPVYVGPKGGKYYINKNGNKTYIK